MITVKQSAMSLQNSVTGAEFSHEGLSLMVKPGRLVLMVPKFKVVDDSFDEFMDAFASRFVRFDYNSLQIIDISMNEWGFLEISFRYDADRIDDTTHDILRVELYIILVDIANGIY